MDVCRILIVDGQDAFAGALADDLADAQCRCDIANSGTAALEACRRVAFDVVVTDVEASHNGGADFVPRLTRLQPGVPLILLGEKAPVATTTTNGRALQFVAKPVKTAAVRVAIQQAIAARASESHAHPAQALPRGTEELLGTSRAMSELRAQVDLVATAGSPVLIHGETGTGKELVARAIHACGPRRTRPFVTVNMSAIPEALLESELFGHARGAFTGAERAHRGLFAEADGGTLLLDEIGDMPMGLQAKLLRVLQSGEVRAVGADRVHHVDVRLVAATHRSLAERVREGRFREDLYYRLNVIAIEVPPLRAHLEDVPELAVVFLDRALSRATSSPARSLSGELVARLSASAWPGNVRELQSAIERLVVHARTSELGVADLSHVVIEPMVASTLDGDPSLDGVIRRHVERVMRTVGGNKAQAAKLLGVDLSTIYRWQRKWRIPQSA